MQKVYERCCGIDVHKQMIAVCFKMGKHSEIRQFGTFTKDLRKMTAWLKEHGCQMVAMESTGPYWKPLFNVFEPGRTSCDRCKCSTYESAAREKNRCIRCGMDCRFAAAWIAEKQFHSKQSTA